MVVEIQRSQKEESPFYKLAGPAASIGAALLARGGAAKAAVEAPTHVDVSAISENIPAEAFSAEEIQQGATNPLLNLEALKRIQAARGYA